MRAAIETRDETRGSTGESHVNVFSPLYLFLLLALLLFHCLQYNNKQGWARRNGADAGGSALSNTGWDRGQAGRNRRIKLEVGGLWISMVGQEQ